MKRIECIVREEGSEGVIRAMAEAGATDITMSAVTGMGVERIPYPALQYWVRIEALVADEEASRYAERIEAVVRKGGMGGGRIVISPVETLVPLAAERKTVATR